jgi:hypothetical protein
MAQRKQFWPCDSCHTTFNVDEGSCTNCRLLLRGMPEYQKYLKELEGSSEMPQAFVTRSAQTSVAQSASVSSIDSISQMHPLIRSAQGHKKDAGHFVRNKINPYPPRGFQSKVNMILAIGMVLMSRVARPVGASI